MTKAEAMRAYLDEQNMRVKLDGELRAAKREKRQADKLLKGQMLSDSRIIGELKRELRKAEAKLAVAVEALNVISIESAPYIGTSCTMAMSALEKIDTIERGAT